MTLTLSGFEEFEKKLTTIHERVAEKALVKMDGSADRATRRMKQVVPVDTGELRDSIKVRWLSREGTKLEFEIYADAPYAPDVEFGTVHMTARPYMNPTIEEERPKFQRDINDAVNEALR